MNKMTYDVSKSRYLSCINLTFTLCLVQCVYFLCEVTWVFLLHKQNGESCQNLSLFKRRFLPPFWSALKGILICLIQFRITWNYNNSPFNSSPLQSVCRSSFSIWSEKPLDWCQYFFLHVYREIGVNTLHKCFLLINVI